MKLCFFTTSDQNTRDSSTRLGLIDGDAVRDVSAALRQLPAAAYPYPRMDAFIAALPTLRPMIEAHAHNAETLALNDVRLLSPVLNPGKVVAAPVNYAKHLEEAIADKATFSREHIRKIQETGLFLKANSSVIGPAAPVRICLPDRRTDHEVELAAIIGKPAFKVSKQDALDYVAGYCIGLDITIRGPEERSLRKSLDTYTVLGPWLVTADEIGDPHALDFGLDVNGETRQRANTRDLIMNVAELIEFASLYYTLEPGDILLTGTPEGVGPIRPGDEMHAWIERIGEIRVAVEAA